MLEHVEKFGIYLNINEGTVVRITSPYWFPPEPEWVVVTKEVNSTLLDVRKMVAESDLYKDSDSVVWGRIPLQD